MDIREYLQKEWKWFFSGSHDASESVALVLRHQNSLDVESGHFLQTSNSDAMDAVLIRNRELLLPLRKDPAKHARL